MNLKACTLLFVLLYLATFLGFSLATAPAYAQEAPAPGVRQKLEAFVNGPDGTKRLASLQKAVAKMKSLDNSTDPQDFRRSWVYWANIHGYFGPSSPDGTVAAQIQYLTQINFDRFVKCRPSCTTTSAIPT